MARVFLRAGEVRDNVEADSINVEKYVKEIAALLADLTMATGRMFEVEHLRMINTVSIHTGGRRRRPPVHQKDTGTQGALQFEGGEWRQRLVQAMAPEVHHCIGSSEGGV